MGHQSQGNRGGDQIRILKYQSISSSPIVDGSLDWLHRLSPETVCLSDRSFEINRKHPAGVVKSSDLHSVEVLPALITLRAVPLP